MSTTSTENYLFDGEYVEVVDDQGNDLPPVPKHWGKEQLAPGASFKKKSAKKSAASSGDAGGSGSGKSGSGSGGGKPDGEPAKNAATEAWVEYAKTKGATEDNLKDADGEPLTRAALVEKYGSSDS